MKKILSLICAASLAFSMMAMTASAAVTKPTVTTEYVDLSAKDDADYHYIGVKVTVEYPQTFGLDYDYDDDDNEIYDGFALAGLTVTFDAGEGYAFNKKNSSVAVGSAAKYGTNGAIINFNATDISSVYDGDSKVAVGTVAFRTAATNNLAERAITCAGTNLDLVSTVWEFDWSMEVTNEYPYQTSAQMDYVGGTIPAYAPAATTANVTVNAGENVVYTASATGELAIGTEVTVTAKPKAGYAIDSANFDAIGGTYTFTVEADTTIDIAAVAVENAPATVATAFVDPSENCVTLFGKAPVTAAEYGIDFGEDTFYNEAQDYTYGPKFAAKSMTAEGFFGIKIHGLPEGNYSVSAYADAANGAVYAFTK